MSHIRRGTLPPEILFDPQRYYFEEDDFIADAPNGQLNWTSALNGGGAAINSVTTGIDSTSQFIGAYELTVGGLLGSRATLIQDTNCMNFGYAQMNWKARVIIPTLSALLQRYDIYIGFIDNSGAGDMTDGAYFHYSDNASSGNWELVTANNGSRTNTNTGIAVDTNAVDLAIRVASDASAVTAFINGTSVATNTTNISTGASRQTSTGFKIEKALGLSARNFVIDYYSLMIAWSTQR